MVAATRPPFGDQIDILVNCAGCGAVKPLIEIDAEFFSWIFDLNVQAALLMSKAVAPCLRVPGRIINISSVGTRRGFAGFPVYGSSKAALEGMTRCLAAELGSKAHRVNAVNLGPVQTDLMDEVQKESTPVENRLDTTDDIAQNVGFLAEERSRWVSRQAISPSGGYFMYQRISLSLCENIYQYLYCMIPKMPAEWQWDKFLSIIIIGSLSHRGMSAHP